MVRDLADNQQWREQMEAGMKAYEQKQKQQLFRAKRKNDKRLERGAKRGEDILQRQQNDHQYLEQKKREYSPEVMGEQEAQAKREFYRQKFQSTRAPLLSPASTVSAAGSSEEDKDGQSVQATPPTVEAGAADEQSRFGVAGMRGALARQRQKDQAALGEASKSKAALASGQMSAEAASAAMKKTVQLIWTAFHEFLEDAALSFVDIMIITGPLCVIVFAIRILGMISVGSILTMKFRGVEVPLVPMFSRGEILPRFLKTLLIAAISSLVWFIIIVLIWAIFDPAGMTWEIIKGIFGGGSTAGGGAGGQF